MATIDLRSNTENPDCVFGVYIHDGSYDIRLLGYCRTKQSAIDLINRLIAQHPDRLNLTEINYSRIWDLDSKRYEIVYDEGLDSFCTVRS